MHASNFPKFPKISVIVINYNGIGFLKDCFESLESVDYPDYEVFLMDNASTDDSVTYAQKTFPWVKILAFDKNYAFAEGYNRAVNSITSEYLYFLNNDTKVDKNFLKEAIKPMLEDSTIAVCGSKMYFYDKPAHLNYAGGKITFIGGGFESRFNEKDQRHIEEPQPTGLACGGAMLVKRYLFLDIGGFDPSYVIYFEDVDLAWRAWLYGYKVVYVPMSVVYHKYGGYFGGFNKSSRSVYLGQINRLSNLWKNAEPFTVFKGSLLSLLYDLVKSAYFLRYLRFSRWLALHKGNIAFLMKLPRVLQQRKTVQQRRKYSDKWLMQNNIIASLNESIAVFFRLLKI